MTVLNNPKGQLRRRRRRRGRPGQGPPLGQQPGPYQRQNVNIPGPPGPAGLPLSSAFEAGRRGLEDAYAGSLGSINAQRGQVQPMLDLNLARLGTNEGESLYQTSADLGGRGIYGPGVGEQVMGDVRSGYDRQRQDMALETARVLNELSQAESETGLGYNQGLTELYLQLAEQNASDPSLATPRRRRRQRRRR